MPNEAPPELVSAGELLVGAKVEGDTCWLMWGRRRTDLRRLSLDVKPPCYVSLWQKRPESEMRRAWSPIGGPNDAMAYRFRKAGRDVMAIGVIGDDIPEPLRSGDRFQNVQRRGYRCAGSAQGVLLVENDATTLPKRNQVGLFCVEIPIDESSFWLTTHPITKLPKG